MADLESERAQLRRRLLGRAPVCAVIAPGVDHGRDLVLIAGPAGRDLAMVAGLDALGQSLTLALTTRLGDDIFNTTFGFDGLNALVDEQNPILQRERIRIAVIQVLRRDPRVRRILDVKLDEGQLDLPAPGRDRLLAVRVDFEAVSGDQVTADLGRVPTNA